VVELVASRHHLPKMDPELLRRDIDALLNPSL